MNIKTVVLCAFMLGLGHLQLRCADETSDHKVDEVLLEFVRFCAANSERCALKMFVYLITPSEKLFEEDEKEIGSLKDVLDNKAKELSAKEFAAAKVQNRFQTVERGKRFNVYTER